MQSSVPFPKTDWLTHRAQASPMHLALIHRGQSWTYAELDEQVGRLAGQLRAAGVKAGQRVATVLPNGPEFIMLIHALIRLGAVLVPLNLRLTADELHWQVEQSESSWILHDDSSAAQADGIQVPRSLSLALDSLPAPATVPSRPFDLSAPLAIIYTSGTTGRPKGALQTLGNYFWSALSSAFRLGTLPNDRWLLTIPLYHVGGLAIPLRCCLYGTTVVIPSVEKFDAQTMLADIEKHAVTLVSLVPTMLQRILDHRRSFPRSLRLILLGGAAAMPKLLEQAQELDLPVALTYGLTESASQIATSTPEQVRHKPGSVGRPLMFTRVSIEDEQGRQLPPGEIGEIVVVGPTIMREYYQQPEATSHALRGGALHTGDLGFLDADSDLWVVERRADLIISGGENVYPAEVERTLLEHPSVREACVVGVEDDIWGQCVAAAIVLHPGAEVQSGELKDFCRQRLAGYKLPRLWRIVPELPHTASGKIQRSVIRNLRNEIQT